MHVYVCVYVCTLCSQNTRNILHILLTKTFLACNFSCGCNDKEGGREEGREGWGRERMKGEGKESEREAGKGERKREGV